MQEISKSEGFIKKNLVFVFLAGLFCAIGIDNNVLLIIGLLILVTAIVLSSVEHSFCWSLFLIPNIRMFDSLGVTFIANILMVLPGLFYFVQKLLAKKPMVHTFPLIGGGILLLMAISYAAFYNEEITPHIMWAMSFLWCSVVIVDEKINVDKNDAVYALATGVIFSAVVYVLSEPDYIRNIMSYLKNDFRFVGFADDPNYYSLYLCISLAAIVIKPKISIFDYCIMAVLVCIGFLTASKMCMILMAICVLYLITFTANRKNKYLRNAVIFLAICFIIYLMRDTLLEFWENLLKRAGGRNATINEISTGRFDAVLGSFRALTNDISTLLIGKGLSYHDHLGEYLDKGAHNTYLDVVLSWGIIGTIIFAWIISYWFKMYKNRTGACYGYTKTSKFPAVVMMIGFLSLSCLGAGMFFFIITVCMLQLEAKEEAETIKTAQGDNDADRRN